MRAKYFQLFSNCIPVKGHKRSIICDIQRNTFEFIPNTLFTILNNKLAVDFEKLLNKYNLDDKKIIEEYFDFLEENEFGFWTITPNKNLSKLDTLWKSFAHITNCIIDIDNKSDFPFLQIKNELDELNCIALQIRFFDYVEINKLKTILDYFKDSKLRSIDLLLQNLPNSDILIDDLKKVIDSNPRISNIHLSNSQNAKKTSYQNVTIHYDKKNIRSEEHCGFISSNHFSINIETFTESINNNSCFNRKISIDKNGFIKNCPSLKEEFGNIKNTSLLEPIKSKSFQKLWNITKDSIEVCKDCEFRYICTDCRAYIEDSGNLFSKPLKCGYDPYTSTWNDWSQNKLKNN